MRNRKLLWCLLFILFSVLLGAQDTEKLLSHKIRISEGTYTIGTILEKLGTENKLNLTYNINDIPVKEKIEIRRKNPTLAVILNEICIKAPLEYQIVSGYIILKKKKLDPYYTISGKITSSGDNEPLIGVNVYLLETMVGAITNEKGEYSFSAKPGNYNIVISSIGYIKYESAIKLYENKSLSVALSSGNTMIQEVKITSEKQFFGDMNTGRTIESIGLTEIETQNINSASDLLHARFAGVWATKTSGLPGDHQKIRIRGLNSLFGSIDPLYVIDGVPVPVVNFSTLGIADLNIHDIANVTILKEASSTAIYGFQGGNGVVLIETKQGGDNEINFISRFGIQRFSHYYNLMETKDFLASMDSSQKYIQQKTRNYYPVYSDTLKSTNWQDEIFQTGFVQEIQLGISGGHQKNKYYFSGNYLNHKGVIAGSSYKRYTFSSNYTHKIFTFLNAGVNYKGSYQNNENNLDSYMGNKIVLEGINKSPCMESTPDRFYINEYGAEAKRIYYNYDPLKKKETAKEYIGNNNTTLKNLSNSISAYTLINIKENLFFNFSGTLSYRRNYLAIQKESENLGTDYFLKSTEDYIVINQQISLNYSKSFKNHNLAFIGAFRNYKDNIWWKVDSSYNDMPQSFYPRSSMSRYGHEGSVIRTIRSYIGHINYNYDQRYFLSIACDYERIREGIFTDKRNLFPSVALNWEIGKENFFNRLLWLSKFNVFANWGLSGNYPLNSLSNDLYSEVRTGHGSQTSVNPVVLQLANHNLKHEQIEEYNIGTKISVFNSRITLNAVWYKKTNSNLIIQRDIPQYYGGGKQYINVNKLFNKGYEIGLEIIPVETHNFKWFTAFNFSSYNQIVTKFQDSSVIFKYDDLLIPDFIIKENEPLGSILGYKILGKWNSSTDVQNISYRNIKNMKVLNADSSNLLINYKDKVIIGNSVPDFIWNLYTSFKYRNIELDFLWYAVIGVDKFNSTRAATYIAGTNPEINKYIYDSIRFIDDVKFYESSLFVEDASFIRLKSLTISYEPEKIYFNRVKARFSLSLENLITFTHYKGYDPESTIFTDNNFTDNSIDWGAYPNPRSIYATISLKF